MDEELAKGATNGVSVPYRKRTVVHLSLCDSIPGYGPISDMTFSLTKNGVGYFPSAMSSMLIKA